MRKRTTHGWKLCVLCKDGSTSWEPLADLKQSYPLLVAQYTTTVDIANKPAFKLWVPYILRKKEQLFQLSESNITRLSYQRQYKRGLHLECPFCHPDNTLPNLVAAPLPKQILPFPIFLLESLCIDVMIVRVLIEL